MKTSRDIMFDMLKNLLVVLNKRHTSENLTLWLEAAIAIVEYAEAAERRGYQQVSVQELHEKHHMAKAKIMLALEKGISL